MPPAIGAIISIGAAVGATLVKSVVVKALITVAASLATKVLAKKPKNTNKINQGSELRTKIDNMMPRQVLAGFIATGGSVHFTHTTTNDTKKPNRFLYRVIQLSDVPIDALVAIKDGTNTLTFAGDVTTGWRACTNAYKSEKGAACFWVRVYKGSMNAVADSTLISETGGLWTSSHKGTGLSYAIIKLDSDPTAFPNGEPEFVFHVRGAHCYDDRKDSTKVGGLGTHRIDDYNTWEYSDTASIVTAQMLRGFYNNGVRIIGVGADERDLDTAMLVSAHNTCEQLVEENAGSNKRYATGMILSADEQASSILEDLQAAMDGKIFDRGGAITILPGANRTPVLALSEQDIIWPEEKSWQPKPSLEAMLNCVSGNFIDSEKDFQEASLPVLTNPQWEIDDGGERFTSFFSLRAVNKRSQGQRINRRVWLASRYGGTVAFVGGIWLLELEQGDWFTLSSARWNFTTKYFEVQEITLTRDLRVSTVGHEVHPNIDGWDHSVDEVPRSDSTWNPPEYDLPVPDIYVNATTTNDSETGLQTFSIEVGLIDPTRYGGFVRYVDVEVYFPDLVTPAGVSRFAVDQGQIAIAGFAPGVEYKVHARTSDGARFSPWTEWIDALTGTGTRIIAGQLDYVDSGGNIVPVQALMPAMPGADSTEEILAGNRSRMTSWDDRAAVEPLPRFSPLFWTVNFPGTMIASVIQPTENSLRMDAVFFERGHLAGLIWDSVDKYDHPTTGYDTKTDYRNTVLDFDYQLIGDVRPINQYNGLTMTIEGRDPNGNPRAYYLQLFNCVTSGDAFNGHIRIDFGDLPNDTSGNALYAGDVDRIFFALVPDAFEDGSTTKLATPVVASLEMTNITASGSDVMLTVGMGPSGVHDVRMTNGYDDTYNVVPQRIARNCRLLGYKGEFNHYVGMSHYFKWAWNSTESRYILVDDASPLNICCVKWHEALASALASVGMELIISLSYELLNSFAPTSWRQLDKDGNPALTGWTPPSTLLSPCNATAMGYLGKVAKQFCAIAAAAGHTVRFQIGEPWYWIGFEGARVPHFYDPDTVAAYQNEKGLTAPLIDTMAREMTTTEIAYLDWLGEKLAASILGLHDVVKASHPNMVRYALLYLPQFMSNATPEAHRVNLPPALAWPALDRLQLEDYDFIIAGDFDASATARARAETTLGYPRSRQEYFAGFVLNWGDNGSQIWRNIAKAIEYAYDWGVWPVYVWAYTQVMRDGFVPTVRAAPALYMQDLQNVDIDSPLIDGQILRYDSATRTWIPSSVEAFIPTLNAPWTNYDNGAEGIRFFRTVEGNIILSGVVKAPVGTPVNDVTLFTLPIGFRPSGNLFFPGISAAGYCRIDVNATGEVILRVGASTEFTSLCGINFNVA